MHRAPPHSQPIEKRRSVQIQELAEELLVHLYRRFSITPYGEFKARIEHNVCVTQTQNRGYSNVQDCVVGIAMDDQRFTGNRNCAPVIADAKESIDRGKISRVITECAPYVCLL